MKSIEELARELIKKLEIVHDDPQYMGVWQCAQNHFGQYAGPTYTEEFTALKSALEKPVEKPWDQPRWFTWGDDYLLSYSSPNEGTWHQLGTGKDWKTTSTLEGNLKESAHLDGYMKEIPAADALAIIEKAKQNDQPAK